LREKMGKKTVSIWLTPSQADNKELLSELREHMKAYSKLQGDHEALEQRYKESLRCVAFEAVGAVVVRVKR